MDKEMKNIGFSLSKISTEQFAIIDDEFKGSDNIQLKSNIRYGANEEFMMISCFVAFVFESVDKPFLMVEGGCHFNIEKDSWADMLDVNTKTISLPKGFVRHLAVLTVGTVRGILHSKTEGTDFNKFVLPTINVAEMISDDAVLKLN